MLKSLATTVALGAITATGAAAQSSLFSSDAGSFSTDGMYIYGYVDLSYLESGSFNETFLRGELDMGMLPGAALSSFAIGWSLGIDAFAVDSDSEIAFYPALTFGSANSLFSVGVPRGVTDRGYLSDHRFARSSLYDLQLSYLFGSFFAFQYLQSGDVPLGLRWDGQFGNTRVGASYQNLESFGNTVETIALAFRHDLDAISSFYELALFGSLQHYWASGLDETVFTIGAEGGSDRLRAGLSYVNSGIIIDNAASAYVEYDITPDLTVDGSVFHLWDSGFSQTTYGLALEYRFLNNAYADISYLDSDTSGTDGIWEVSVGWRF